MTRLCAHRAARAAAALTLSLLFALICTGTVSAGYFTFETEEEQSERSPAEYGNDFNEALPSDLRALFSDEDGSVTSAPWQSVLSEAFSSLADELFPALTRFGVLCSVCILCSVLGTIVRTTSTGALGRAAPFISRCAIICTAVGWHVTSLDVMASAISRISTVTSSFIPALTVMCAASGGAASGALATSGFAMLCTLAENGFAALALPMLRTSLALVAVSSAASSKIAGAVSKFIRTTLTVICTTGMTLFVFFFNLQMGLARSADSAMYRTVRLALSSIIPVVGGQVANASEQLGASLSLIRTSCGVIAVCAVIVLTLPMLLRLVCDRALLFICRHIAGAIAEDADAEALEELGSVCTLEIAVAVSVSVTFVLCLFAFVRAAGAIT